MYYSGGIVFLYFARKIFIVCNLMGLKNPCYSSFIENIIFKGDDMKNIESIANDELLTKLVALSANERSAVAEVVLYLHQLDKRGLYRDAGFSSLFAYCREKLKYSEGATCRRIVAARALSTSPEIYELLREGKISLCTINQVSRAITEENKDQILKAVPGQTSSQVQKILVEYGVAQKAKREKIMAKKVKVPASVDLFSEREEEKEERGYSVTLELTEGEMELVHEARRMLGKGQIKDVLLKGAHDIKRKARVKSDKKEPKATTTSAVIEAETFKPKKQSRYISAAVKREVALRDKNQCTYCSPDGHRCTERYRLEYDHIQPFALGGSNEAHNLRLVCRAHNSLYAERAFGFERIRGFKAKGLKP